MRASTLTPESRTCFGEDGLVNLLGDLCRRTPRGTRPEPNRALRSESESGAPGIGPLMKTTSTSPLWLADSGSHRDHLEGHLDVDVAVIGAGITGLTTAVLLAREGRSVALLEGERVAWGTSGRTTAKVSALQGIRYQTIIEHHGRKTAALYASSQTDAAAWIRNEARRIDCDWEAQPSITYADTPESRLTVTDEREAAHEAGLDVDFVESFGDTPVEMFGAVVLHEQAQFDPYRYLAALASELSETDGCHVFERTRVTSVSGHRRVTVHAGSGSVTARHVVVATLLPIVDRGLFFARAEPKASYTLAVRTTTPPTGGMFLSAGSPIRSFRTVRRDDGELLLVGGNGHVVGRRQPTEPQYEDLLAWTEEHFGVEEIVTRWMAHDYVPVDHLPWVGLAWPGSPGVLIATGFEKWGMTGGTAAGLALADRILGRNDGPSAAWSSIFNPLRSSARSVPSLARLSTEVAVQMAAGWLSPTSPGANGGERYRDGLAPAGLAVDDNGTEHSGSVVCTHLGGPCT